MPGANCRPLRVLRVPRTPFPGHSLNAKSQLYEDEQEEEEEEEDEDDEDKHATPDHELLW